MSEPKPAEEPILNIPNLKYYYGPESLPPGSSIDTNVYGTTNPLNEFVLAAANRVGIKRSSKVLNYYHSHNENGAIFGSMAAGLSEMNQKAFLIAEEMSNIQPNLAWMRGGTLNIQDNVAVLDESAGEGMVGCDVSGLAKLDFYWKPRENPTIFLIKWKSIIEAAKKKLYVPSTHHIYDFYLMGLGNAQKDIEWQKENLTAYKVVT